MDWMFRISGNTIVNLYGRNLGPTCLANQERDRTNVVQLQGTHSQLVVDTSLSVPGLTVIV